MPYDPWILLLFFKEVLPWVCKGTWMKLLFILMFVVIRSWRHMKKCSTSLGIREIQIKTTMRSHLTLVRMAKIIKSGNDRCWWGCKERGSILQCWWECKMVQQFWKTVWRFLKKLKIELRYDPAIALLGVYPKDTNVVIRSGSCMPMSIAAMSTVANSQ